jgi:hypothetical protein
MPTYTQGDTRITLTQADVIAGQNNGSLVIDSERSRPYWFDGRFLAARDLQREQDYFLQRQADLGQAAGFSVIHGLQVDTPAANDTSATADTVIIRAGQGLTPAGELVLLPNVVRPARRAESGRAIQPVADPQYACAHAHRRLRARAASGRVHRQPHRLLPHQYSRHAHHT